MSKILPKVWSAKGKGSKSLTHIDILDYIGVSPLPPPGFISFGAVKVCHYHAVSGRKRMFYALKSQKIMKNNLSVTFCKKEDDSPLLGLVNVAVARSAK